MGHKVEVVISGDDYVEFSNKDFKQGVINEVFFQGDEEHLNRNDKEYLIIELGKEQLELNNIKLYNLGYKKLTLFSNNNLNLDEVDLSSFEEVELVIGQFEGRDSYQKPSFLQNVNSEVSLKNIKAKSLKINAQNIKINNGEIADLLEISIPYNKNKSKLTIENTTYASLKISNYNQGLESFIKASPENAKIYNYTGEKNPIKFYNDDFEFRHYGDFIDISCDFTKTEIAAKLHKYKFKLSNYLKKFKIGSLVINSNESLNFHEKVTVEKLIFKGKGDLIFDKEVSLEELSCQPIDKEQKILFNSKVNVNKITKDSEVEVYLEGTLITKDFLSIKTLELNGQKKPIYTLICDDGVGIIIDKNDLSLLSKNTELNSFKFYLIKGYEDEAILIDYETPTGKLNHYNISLLKKISDRGEKFVEIIPSGKFEVNNKVVRGLKQLYILNKEECILKNGIKAGEIIYNGSLDKSKLIVEGSVTINKLTFEPNKLVKMENEKESHLIFEGNTINEINIGELSFRGNILDFSQKELTFNIGKLAVTYLQKGSIILDDSVKLNCGLFEINAIKSEKLDYKLLKHFKNLQLNILSQAIILEEFSEENEEELEVLKLDSLIINNLKTLDSNRITSFICKSPLEVKNIIIDNPSHKTRIAFTRSLKCENIYFKGYGDLGLAEAEVKNIFYILAGPSEELLTRLANSRFRLLHNYKEKIGKFYFETSIIEKPYPQRLLDIEPIDESWEKQIKEHNERVAEFNKLAKERKAKEEKEQLIERLSEEIDLSEIIEEEIQLPKGDEKILRLLHLYFRNLYNKSLGYEPLNKPKLDTEPWYEVIFYLDDFLPFIGQGRLPKVDDFYNGHKLLDYFPIGAPDLNEFFLERNHHDDTKLDIPEANYHKLYAKNKDGIIFIPAEADVKDSLDIKGSYIREFKNGDIEVGIGNDKGIDLPKYIKEGKNLYIKSNVSNIKHIINLEGLSFKHIQFDQATCNSELYFLGNFTCENVYITAGSSIIFKDLIKAKNIYLSAANGNVNINNCTSEVLQVNVGQGSAILTGDINIPKCYIKVYKGDVGINNCITKELGINIGSGKSTIAHNITASLVNITISDGESAVNNCTSEVLQVNVGQGRALFMGSMNTPRFYVKVTKGEIYINNCTSSNLGANLGSGSLVINGNLNSPVVNIEVGDGVTKIGNCQSDNIIIKFGQGRAIFVGSLDTKKLNISITKDYSSLSKLDNYINFSAISFDSNSTIKCGSFITNALGVFYAGNGSIDELILLRHEIPNARFAKQGNGFWQIGSVTFETHGSLDEDKQGLNEDQISKANNFLSHYEQLKSQYASYFTEASTPIHQVFHPSYTPSYKVDNSWAEMSNRLADSVGLLASQSPSNNPQEQKSVERPTGYDIFSPGESYIFKDAIKIIVQKYSQAKHKLARMKDETINSITRTFKDHYLYSLLINDSIAAAREVNIKYLNQVQFHDNIARLAASYLPSFRGLYTQNLGIIELVLPEIRIIHEINCRADILLISEGYLELKESVTSKSLKLEGSHIVLKSYYDGHDISIRGEDDDASNNEMHIDKKIIDCESLYVDSKGGPLIGFGVGIRATNAYFKTGDMLLESPILRESWSSHELVDEGIFSGDKTIDKGKIREWIEDNPSDSDIRSGSTTKIVVDTLEIESSGNIQMKGARFFVNQFAKTTAKNYYYTCIPLQNSENYSKERSGSFMGLADYESSHGHSSTTAFAAIFSVNGYYYGIGSGEMYLLGSHVHANMGALNVPKITMQGFIGTVDKNMEITTSGFFMGTSGGKVQLGVGDVTKRVSEYQEVLYKSSITSGMVPVSGSAGSSGPGFVIKSDHIIAVGADLSADITNCKKVEIRGVELASQRILSESRTILGLKGGIDYSGLSNLANDVKKMVSEVDRLASNPKSGGMGNIEGGHNHLQALSATMQGVRSYMSGYNVLQGGGVEVGAWVSFSHSESGSVEQASNYVSSIINTGKGTRTIQADEVFLEGVDIIGEGSFKVVADKFTHKEGMQHTNIQKYAKSFEIQVSLSGDSMSAKGSKTHSSFIHDEVVVGHVNIKGDYILEIKDGIISGVQVYAENIDLTKCNNLILKSVQDKIIQKMKNMSFSMNLGKGAAANMLGGGGGSITDLVTGISPNFESSDKRAQFVKNMTQLIGRNSVRIIAAEALEISGAMIANAVFDASGKLHDKGNLEVKAAKTTFNNIKDYAEGYLFEASMNLKKARKPDHDDPFGNVGDIKFGVTNLARETLSTIGMGSVDLGEVSGPGIINRDINNAQTKTKGHNTVLDARIMDYGTLKDSFPLKAKGISTGDKPKTQLEDAYDYLKEVLNWNTSEETEENKEDKELNEATKKALKKMAIRKALEEDFEDALGGDDEFEDALDYGSDGFDEGGDYDSGKDEYYRADEDGGAEEAYEIRPGGKKGLIWNVENISADTKAIFKGINNSTDESSASTIENVIKSNEHLRDKVDEATFNSIVEIDFYINALEGGENRKIGKYKAGVIDSLKSMKERLIDPGPSFKERAAKGMQDQAANIIKGGNPNRVLVELAGQGIKHLGEDAERILSQTMPMLKASFDSGLSMLASKAWSALNKETQSSLKEKWERIKGATTEGEREVIKLATIGAAAKVGSDVLKGISGAASEMPGLTKGKIKDNILKKEEISVKIEDKSHTTHEEFKNYDFGPDYKYFPKQAEWKAPSGTKQTYKVYQRGDIDWDMVRTDGPIDFKGKTNREAALKGLAPQLTDGEFVALHHVGQDARGPLVEVNTKIHNPKNQESFRPLHNQFGINKGHPEFPVDRSKWKTDKENYWKWRAMNDK